MNRPVSGSDFGYQIPLSDGLHTIVDGLEYDETASVADPQLQLQQQQQQQHPVNPDSLPPTYECAMLSASSNGNGNGCDNLTPLGLAERSSRLQHQISSGVGTQQNDSRDEATYTESIELRLLGQYNSTDTDPYAYAPDQRSGSFDTDEAYLKYQKSLLTRSPSYRKSLDRLSQSSGQSQRSLLPSRSLKSDESAMRRHSSGHSLNSISLEQDELLSQQANLRDELLNCDQKELFQFLQEDEELLGKANNKKQTTNSLKSNLSYISNSIMQTLDSRHSGSHCSNGGNGQHESEPLMEHSEFDNIIQSFEKELEEIKRSTSSLERKISTLSEPSPAADEATKAIMDHIAIITGASDRTAADEVVHPLNPYDSYDLSSVPRRSQSVSAAAQRQSVKLKRRSLEKQRKIDEDFSISNEIRKICDQIHAPFAAMEALAVAATSASSGSGSASISGGQSPFMRRKNDPFSVQFDRFKRLSLIERVEELPEEDKPISTLRIESEKMPRKFVNSDKLRMDSMSLKSTNSYENLLIQKQLCRDAGQHPTTLGGVPVTPPTSLKSSIEPPTLAQISSLKATPPLAALTEHQQHYHATSIQTTDTAAAAAVAAAATTATTITSKMHPSAVGVAGRRRAEHPQSTLDKAASFQSARTESHSSGAADSSSALGLALGQHGHGHGHVAVPGKRSLSNGHQDRGASEKTETTQQASKPSAFSRLTEKPWHCLVSYVDDLTVGGRRNSQGAYNDPMTFPSFGQAKPPKVPDDCFPQKCYEQ